MNSPTRQTVLDQFKALSPEEQLQVAATIDRLTWAQRWRRICERVATRIAGGAPPPSDAEIEAEVKAVRREKPLSERSSTHPS